MAEERPMESLRLDEAVEGEQVERVGRLKASRDMTKVEKRLKQLADACRGGQNVMPVLVDAVKDYVSLGEVSDVYRQAFGLYRGPIFYWKERDNDRRHQGGKVADAQTQAQGLRVDLRHDLHGPHVRGRLPGGEGLVRSAGRALRAPPTRSGGGRTPLLPGHLRRAPGLPWSGAKGPAVPAAEARRAHEPFGGPPVHPAARSGAGAALARDP